MKKRILSFILVIFTLLHIMPWSILDFVAESDDLYGMYIEDMTVGVPYSAEFVVENETFLPYKLDEEGYLIWPGYPDFSTDSYVFISDFPQDLKVVRMSEEDISCVYVINEDWPAEYDDYRYLDMVDVIIRERIYDDSEEGFVFGEVGLVFDGDSTDSLTIYKGEKKYVFTELGDAIGGTPSYTWQISLGDDKWATIQDYCYPYAVISEALINEAVLGDGATIRCIAAYDGVNYVSDELDIYVDRSEYGSVESVSYTSLDHSAYYYASADGVGAGEDSSHESRDGGNVTEAFHITVNYIFWNNAEGFTKHGSAAYPTFTVTILPGGEYKGTRPIPVIPGYKSYTSVPEGTEGAIRYVAPDPNNTTESLEMWFLRIDEIVFDETGERKETIYFLPDLVSYTVNHYFQNLSDDEYFLQKTVHAEGYADSPVGEDLYLHSTSASETSNPYDDIQYDPEVIGFEGLFYDPKTVISSNGNTTIDIYYDRKYYLVDYQLKNNGVTDAYGVVPLYVRYETKLSFVQPTAPGYAFNGWTLTSIKDDNGTELKDDATVSPLYATTLQQINVMHNLVYTANWKTATTSYTVIYWLENADDSNFTMYGFKVIDKVAPGTQVSAANDIDYSEKQYFTFNSTLSDKNVTVRADGMTVVNAYYLRNYYTLTFNASGSTCLIEEHVHDSSCPSGECDREVHVHTDACGVDGYTCGKTEHPHDASCCSIPEHEHGKGNCTCDDSAHTHGDDCYNHKISCYTTKTLSEPTGTNAGYVDNISNPQSGYVYRYRVTSNSYRNYFYLNGEWYYLGTSNNNSSTTVFKNDYGITLVNSLSRPSKNSQSTSVKAVLLNGEVETTLHCGLTEHVHGAGTCPCDNTEHVHGRGCNYICGFEYHVHVPSCTTYECGKTAHTHNADCVRECQIYVHEHTSSCDGTSSKNFQIIKRKYGSDIASVWRSIWEVFPDGERWKPSPTTLYSQVLVYLPFMPPQSITFTKDVGGTNNYRIHYYLQSLGEGEHEYDGLYFDLNNTVNAKYGYLSEAEDFFDITGFTQYKSSPAFDSSGEIRDDVDDAYMYYTRNKYLLKFMSNGVPLTELNKQIFYQQPIDSSFRPANVPNPENKESGSVRFVGWYTTESCADGTEFVFDGSSTMPLNGLTLYAKWETTIWSVKVYNDISLDETKLLASYSDVPFGTILSSAGYEIPSVGSFGDGDESSTKYIFAGWYYVNSKGEETRFDFNTMPVKENLNIYAKWTSRVPVKFTVSYLVQESGGYVKIADDTTGVSLAGVFKSFIPKVNTDLYDGYQSGYYPTVVEMTEKMNEDESLNNYCFTYEYSDTVSYKITHKFSGEGIEDILGSSEPLVLSWIENGSSSTEAQLTFHFESFINKTSIRDLLGTDEYEKKYGDLDVDDLWMQVIQMSPDALTKRLILTPDNDKNEIVFNWIELNHIAVYEVHHYYQSLNDSNSYDDGPVHTIQVLYDEDDPGDAEFQLSPAKGFKCARYSYNDKNGTLRQVNINSESGTFDTYPEVFMPSASGGEFKVGLVINVYYNRATYNYTVKFLDQITNASIHEDLTDSGLYEEKIILKDLIAEVEDELPQGYTSTHNDTDFHILKDDGDIILCYFVKQNVTYTYAVSNGGYETVPDEETVSVGEAPSGSEPVGLPGYTFDHWMYWDPDQSAYVDIDGKATVDQETGKITPNIPLSADAGKTLTFIAFFKPSELTVESNIVINGTPSQVTDGQGFIYVITGSDDDTSGINLRVAAEDQSHVTILGLPSGQYTISVENDWSWRYYADPMTIFFDGDETVVFSYADPVGDRLDENDSIIPGSFYETSEAHN